MQMVFCLILNRSERKETFQTDDKEECMDVCHVAHSNKSRQRGRFAPGRRNRRPCSKRYGAFLDFQYPGLREWCARATTTTVVGSS